MYPNKKSFPNQLPLTPKLEEKPKRSPSGIPPELNKPFPTGDREYVRRLVAEFQKKYGK